FFHGHAIRFNAFLPMRRNSIKIDGSIPISTINYHAISHDFATQGDYIFWIFSTLFFFVVIDGFARRNMADLKSTRLNSSHVSIYVLSLHDALPIFLSWSCHQVQCLLANAKEQHKD